MIIENILLIEDDVALSNGVRFLFTVLGLYVRVYLHKFREKAGGFGVAISYTL